jgi:hypothetical protein
MKKIAFWALITISIVNAIVSLVIGHINNYYNPNITANINGFVASAIAISLIILSSINHNKQYLVKMKVPVLLTNAIIAIISLSFQFALGFYYGAFGSAIWLFNALYNLFDQGYSDQA